MLLFAEFLLPCKPKCDVSSLLVIPSFPLAPSVVQASFPVLAAAWEASVSSSLLDVLRKMMCDAQGWFSHGLSVTGVFSEEGNV